MPLYSSFSFSLNNRARQQLAKLLLLWRREEEIEVIKWGPVAQAVLGTDNAISTLERGDRAFVPFIFPWFQYLLTICNMPPLAFGIHNEQYDCDMVIIWGL